MRRVEKRKDISLYWTFFVFFLLSSIHHVWPNCFLKQRYFNLWSFLAFLFVSFHVCILKAGPWTDKYPQVSPSWLCKYANVKLCARSVVSRLAGRTGPREIKTDETPKSPSCDRSSRFRTSLISAHLRLFVPRTVMSLRNQKARRVVCTWWGCDRKV